MPIRILPDHLINRIRAGEVVERPAQIVKELLENAIDSGATGVKIQIASGGRKLVRVTDNGTGMIAYDLDTCVERHATSKLHDDDLADISTLGFRGEALSAIGAVSHLEIRSRHADDEHGWSVEVRDGEKSDLKPCSQAKGTTVTVTRLFDSHPARAAFLRRPKQEAALILDIVRSIALANTEVDISLDSDDRQVFKSSSRTLESRILDVMGEEFVHNSVAFSGEHIGIRVEGRVGVATWNGHGAAGQYFVVNGRGVRDRILSNAVREVFRDISSERNPAICLYVALERAAVDVNVHPTKSEIRFRRERDVHLAVTEAVSAALAASGPISASMLSSAATLAARPVDGICNVDPRTLPLGRPLGMALNTFAVCETTDSIVMVDLHAAHERVVHEKLKAFARDGNIPARALPGPVTVKVGEKALAILEEREDELAAIGLSFIAMDSGTVAVTSVPEPLYGTDADGLMRDLAKELLSNPHGNHLIHKVDRLCSLLACHSAFRSGDEITPDDIAMLLREIENTPNSAQCNHGRPTAISLERKQIESLFGRR